jgi:adenylyltransferase/sulfurtransferase
MGEFDSAAPAMSVPRHPPVSLDRYVRQMRFAPLGEAGQARLAAGRVLVCGCGALGSTAANLLVRAGVGRVRIADRDFVDLSNLHRQVLFDEQDAAAGMPKAVAAAEKLRRINSQVEIEPVVADVESGNVEALCEGVQVIVDGTDNFETRFLVNDASVKLGIPWIYGGCLGGEGQTLAILPGQTPCLACLIDECPPPGALATCDTAGILGPVVGVIASLEALWAIKILSGHPESVPREWIVLDLWNFSLRQLRTAEIRPDCPVCQGRQFAWLAGKRGSRSAVLCGRNAVQLTSPGTRVSLDELERKLHGLGRVTRNPFLVRLAIRGHEITVFADGRAIVGGTSDAATARTLYAKFVGL